VYFKLITHVEVIQSQCKFYIKQYNSTFLHKACKKQLFSISYQVQDGPLSFRNFYIMHIHLLHFLIHANDLHHTMDEYKGILRKVGPEVVA
jgi:hypothetical protein